MILGPARARPSRSAQVGQMQHLVLAGAASRADHRTVRARPHSCRPFSASIAASACDRRAKSTKANPRGCPA